MVILEEPNIGVDELDTIVCELYPLEMKTCALGCACYLEPYVYFFEIWPEKLMHWYNVSCNCFA